MGILDNLVVVTHLTDGPAFLTQVVWVQSPLSNNWYVSICAVHITHGSTDVCIHLYSGVYMFTKLRGKEKKMDICFNFLFKKTKHSLKMFISKMYSWISFP